MNQANQVFICTITGLSTTFNIPAIENKGVEFLSPIAQPSVARQYSALDYKELQSLPTEVLSALFLSLASSLYLIEDKLSGFNRNSILSKNTKYDLITAIKLLSPLDMKKASKIPSISLASSEPLITDKILTETFTAYIKTLREVLINTYYENNREAHTLEYVERMELKALGLLDSKAKVLKVQKSNIKPQKEAFKKHLVTIELYPTIADSKVFDFLKTISQNNNLETASSDIRTKIINKLNNIVEAEKIEDFALLTALTSIKNILTKTSPSELKEPTSLDKAELVATSNTKKSLKEILAERNRSREAIADTVEETTSSNLESTTSEENSNV